MTRCKSRHLCTVGFGLILSLLLAFSLACSATASPTPEKASATATTVIVPTPTRAPVTAPTPTVAPVPTSDAKGMPVNGGTLRFALATGIKSLDPLHNVDYKERHVEYSVYNGLVKMDPKMNIVPDLAQSWDIAPDGKTITFRLVKGVKFHDGTDFNAQAVKWNIDKIADPTWGATGRSYIATAFAGTEATDDQTLILKLKQAWRPMLASLSLSDALIISPTAYDKWGDKYPQHPTGTGPFILKEWLVDNRIIITKNDKYWEKGLPYLDAVEYRMIPDKSVQLAMLRTNEAELVDELSGPELDVIKGNTKIRAESLDTNNWESTFFRITKAPFNNKALRQAISFAMDKQKMVDAEWQGHAAPGWTTFGFSWWGDSSYQPYRYDPQKAKQKLAEAGYPQGITVPYWCQGTDSELRECEIVQAMLAESGIKVDIKVVVSADWAKIRESECGWCRQSYRVRPDPDFVNRWALHSQGSAAKNRAGYSNPQVDKLIDDAAGTYDTAKAGPMYIQAQKLVFDEAVYVSYYFQTWYAARSLKLQNFTWYPDTFIRFGQFWLDK